MNAVLNAVPNKTCNRSFELGLHCRNDTEQFALALAAKRLPTIPRSEQREQEVKMVPKCYVQIGILLALQDLSRSYRPRIPWNPEALPDLLCIGQLREVLADGFCLTSQGARVT